MIRYTLKCDKDHQFESWFASATAFDGLNAAGHVQCTQCGSAKIEKALMAPAVTQTQIARSAPTEQAPATPPDKASKLADLRREVEANSDYVGNKFADEARAMHDGDAPERAIWGEARLDEAKALLDDGVPVMPLPFLPKSKTN